MRSVIVGMIAFLVSSFKVVRMNERSPGSVGVFFHTFSGQTLVSLACSAPE